MIRGVCGCVLFSLCAGLTPCSATTLGLATGWNIFTFGDVNYQNGQISGGVASGGSITLLNTGVAVAVSPIGSNTAVEVLAAGSVSLTGGNVNGSVQYGTTGTLNGTALSSGATFQQSPSAINFSSAKTDFVTFSDQIAALLANGSVAVTPSTITLTGTDADTNIFTLTAGETTATNFVINVPSGSSVIINVTASTVAYNYAGFQANGVGASGILWNAPNATSVSVAGVPLLGTIVAPNATVDLSNGSLNGQLIAQAMTGSSYGVSYTEFTGNLPVEVTPEPASVLLVAPAFALFFLIKRLRDAAGKREPGRGAVHRAAGR